MSASSTREEFSTIGTTPEPPNAAVRVGSRPRVLLWAAAFGLLAVLMLIAGLESVFHFVGPAIDGPFQLYNALRRIAAGQTPGVDFQFFHGVGVPYLHYPLFRLFGGSFFASEFSRQIMSALLYPAVALAFLKFFLRDWPRAIVWATIVMLLSIALRMTALLIAVNSLLGVRSTMPLVLAMALCVPWSRTARNIFCALTLGAALLLATEQGLAMIAALACIAAVVAIRERSVRGFPIDVVTTIGGGVATMLAFLLAVGGARGMRGALAYNLRDVPLDQYWFFGAPPNPFIESWSDLPTKLAMMPRVGMSFVAGVVLFGVVLRALWQTADSGDRRRHAALAALSLYGLLSCASLLGSFAGAYVQPLMRVVMLVGAVYLAPILDTRDERRGQAWQFGVPRSTRRVAVFSLLLMTALDPSIYTATIFVVPHVISDHVFGGTGPVLAGTWPETLRRGQAVLDARRDARGQVPTLWSTYSGLLEARNGSFNPSFDYMIHALGPEHRAAYLASFEHSAPRLVQTVHPDYTQYESWLEDTNWDFYTVLLRNYDVVGSTDWSLFWERRPAAADSAYTLWQGSVPSRATSIALPLALPANSPAAHALVQIELTYEINNPLSKLPVVGALPRYLVSATGVLRRDPVSLRPYATVARFPLLLERGKTPRLAWRTASLLPGAAVTVQRIRVSTVPITPANAVWFSALIDQQSRTMDQ